LAYQSKPIPGLLPAAFGAAFVRLSTSEVRAEAPVISIRSLCPSVPTPGDAALLKLAIASMVPSQFTKLL
jgi:hypothetical protein